MIERKEVERIGLDFTWKTVCTLLRISKIRREEVIDFSCKEVGKYSGGEDDRILELCWGDKDLKGTRKIVEGIVRSLYNIPDNTEIGFFEEEVRKIRYVEMVKLLERRLDKKDIYQGIDMIYSCYGYPEDMYQLISYHSYDTVESEALGKRKELIEEIEEFIQKEGEELRSGIAKNIKWNILHELFPV